ncbi:ankyrin repeat domain-containing protein 12-like isoform X2 [Ptychodera flava]
MQMTSGEHSPDATPKQQSPSTPSMSSTSIRTQPVTPTSSITSSGGKVRVNKRNEKGETQLHTAAIKGDVQTTKSLIKQGADVNCQDFAGWTPLHEACNHGFYDIAKQLLKAGANVNIQGLNDITPLHDAAVNGHVKVVELLLKHGANPLQANNTGKTPLNIARSQQIIQLLKNEIICSSSDMSSPEVRSPTSPESSSTEGDIVLDPEEDCNQFSSEDGNRYAMDNVMNRGMEVNRNREEFKGTDSAAESTATGSSNAEQMLRLHDLDSRESSPDRFRMSPLEEEKEREAQEQQVSMEVSSPSSTQSSSSDQELFDPHLTTTSRPRVETNKKHESVANDTKSPVENDKKRRVDSSSDSDSSDSSDTESTKSDNADHGCSSSSDSSSSSDTDSEKEESKKNKKEQIGAERTDMTDNSSPKDRNIFSTIQQTIGPNKPCPGKHASSTYSIIHPSSKDNRNQGLQDRTVPKITIRLPQLSPKRDSERKRSKDDDSERPKEPVKHQSPLGHVLGQERTLDKYSEPDQKYNRDGQAKELSWQGKFEGTQSLKSVIVTSSHNISSIDDAAEIKTLLLKPRETGRFKEANSPATSTSSESSNTSSSRRRQSKAEFDHSSVSSSSSGKIMTRSATQEGVTTRSSGRNSPKVAPESLVHSEKGDKSVKESSPARSGKGSPQVPHSESQQTVSGKSSPKVVSDIMNSGSEQASPSRSADTPTPTVGKLTIRVGQGESTSQTAKTSPKGAGDAAPMKTEPAEERPQRITRSLRSNSQAQTNNTNSDNSNQEKEKETINVPLTRSRRNQTESAAPSEPNPVESHPRKRKMARHREPPPEPPVVEPPPRPPVEQRTNPFEMFLNIRQNIAQRHKNLCPVTTKPPQGFLEYLTYRKNYVLDNSDVKKRNAIPKACPPDGLALPLKELFEEQEVPRQKLKTRHYIEREKLTIAAEQEIMRVHANAARALANQSIPYSVCSILRDQDIYNMPEQQPPDEDGKSIRARYNGRQLISWLRDVDDKYEKIKETLVHRQQHEVASLYAVQKMEWECKLSELRMLDLKKPPVISNEHVPIVEVNKDFDLLPT